MKTTFKNQHLYLGCICIEKSTGNQATFNIDRLNKSLLYPEDYTLILRPLSDMIQEEAIELCSIHNPNPFDGDRLKHWVKSEVSEMEFLTVSNKKNAYSFQIDCTNGDVSVYKDDELHTTDGTAKMTAYLLSQHFDLFNLIPQGIAIDATTLPNNPYK